MIRSTTKKICSLLMAVLLLGTLASPRTAEAAEAIVTASTTSNFAILAGQTITNTGSTEVTGDIGLHPGTEVPGKEDVVITGEWHLADAVALTGKNDLVTAYDDAASRTPEIISRELGGQTLTPGVYISNEKDFILTGELVLDGEGDPDAVFIFQTDTTLITGSASTVVLTNGATPCGLFWKIGTSATLGSNSQFAGRILALTSITLETGAEVRGQLLASNGSVTLDDNKVISGPCAGEKTATATLHVIILVVNEEGETAQAGDFSIQVLKDGLDVEGSPSRGMDTPGRAYTLEAGEYRITEEPVEGYSASYSGDSSDGSVTLAPGEEKTVIITNTRINGQIVVEKYDEKGNLLPGAEFTLYKDDIQLGDSLVTDENGVITFTGIPKGIYTLHETKVPEGYVLNDIVDEVEIMEDNETVVVTVTNYRIMGQVNIRKIDADTGAVLAGAAFRITDSSGDMIFEGKTDRNGMISVEVPYGMNVIEEVNAPQNYVKSDKKYSVDVSHSGQIFNLDIKNTKAVETAAILPKAGVTGNMSFLFMGVLAIASGALLLRKRKIA